MTTVVPPATRRYENPQLGWEDVIALERDQSLSLQISRRNVINRPPVNEPSPLTTNRLQEAVLFAENLRIVFWDWPHTEKLRNHADWRQSITAAPFGVHRGTGRIRVGKCHKGKNSHLPP